MPLAMVHLRIAELACEKAGQPENAAFLLGNLLPDAVLTRPGGAALKDMFHRCQTASSWETDVLRAFQSVPDPSDAERGYTAHILSDIAFRKLLRAYYEECGVKEAERSAWDAVIIAFVGSTVYSSPETYLRILTFAASARIDGMPFGLTDGDIAAELMYAKTLAGKCFGPVGDGLPCPPPDIGSWAGELADRLVRFGII